MKKVRSSDKCSTVGCKGESSMTCLGVPICDDCFNRICDGNTIDTHMGMIRRETGRLVVQ